MNDFDIQDPIAEYDHKTILSLKLRAASNLRRLSRGEFFNRLQLIRVLDPLVDDAYKEVEDRVWREHLDDSPHGQPWHVSFHGSQFPGDDAMACPRQAMYRMIDLPRERPFNRNARTVMAAGKAIESELVRVFNEAGLLLSAPEDAELQTNYEDPDAWLTATVDAIIQKPGVNMPLPIEVKSKYQDVIDKMRCGAVGPDPGHIKQLKVEIAFTRIIQRKLWPAMDLATHGYIYYLSRDKPEQTAEFRVDYDERFWLAGLEKLKEWKRYFHEDVLPSIDPSKRHPMGWFWTKHPCQWCDFGQACRADHKEGVDVLSESKGIEMAREIRPDYDFEAAKLRVMARWHEGKKSSPDQPASGKIVSK